MGAGQPETAQESAKLEDLTEDSDYAPLLPSPSVSKDGPTATGSAIRPPAVVSVQRDADMLKTGAAKANGYRTDLCDCCAEPGGLRLCKRPCKSFSTKGLCFTPLVDTGCYGYWCAPCLFGQNVENLGPVRWSGDQVHI